MKKRVIGFFILVLAFVFLIGLLHYLNFGGFTGFAVLNNYNYPEFGFHEAKTFSLAILAFLIVFFLASKISAKLRRTKKRRELIDLDMDYLLSDRA